MTFFRYHFDLRYGRHVRSIRLAAAVSLIVTASVLLVMERAAGFSRYVK